MKIRYSLTANSRKSYGFTAALVVLSLTVISLTANAQLPTITDTWAGATTAWDTATNWSSGTVPTGTDNVLLPSTYPTSGSSIVLTNDVANSLVIENLYSLTGGTLTLTSGTIYDFNTATTSTISSVITSTNGLTLVGSGSGGQILLNASANNISGGPITITNTIVNTTTGGGIRINSDAALGTAPSTPTADIYLNNGTLTTLSTFTLNANRSIVISGTGELNVAASTTLTYGGTISDGTTAGTLWKNSGGTLYLTGTNNYSGGTYVFGGGTLEIANSSALGSGTLSLSGTTTLSMANTTADTITNNIALVGSGTVTLTKAATSAIAGTQETFSGNISGGSSSTVLYLNSNTSGDDTTDFNFTGNNTFVVSEINLNRGTITVNNANSLGASTNLVYLDANNNTTNGDLQFASSMTFANPIQLVNSSNPIGTGTNSVTLSGVLSGNGLNKVGNGTMTLTAANTYTGVTTVSGGTLLVNGNQSAATGAVTVASGATLGGTGTIGGATTVNGNIFAGVTIGATAGNVLHTGALTLASTTTYQLDLNSTANTSDELISTGAISLNGTLAITDLDAGTPTGNLTIMQGTTLSGSFTGLAQGALVDNGLYMIDYTGDSVMLIAVPEPSTFVLAGIFGFGMLLLFRRRSNRIANR